jgi:Thiamine pyrophosphate enzyme, N-terminal TPP binding domain/D-isomer specific 2-hydroxyacid dehydrogenase, NAD binding domain
VTEMSAGRAVVELLKAEGVRHVFGLVGSTFLDVLDVLHDDKSVEYVNVRHEQGGAFMADGLARITDTPARLRAGAIVINSTRGEVADEQALADALESGHPAGAGVDVFGGEPPPPDHPLLRVRAPGLVLAPPLAGSVFDNVANVARHAFRNIERVLEGQALPPADLVSLGAEA